MFEAFTSLIQPLSSHGLPIVVDASLKSAALLLLAAGVCAVIRRRSAAERHLVWSVAVAGALAMPILSRVTPALEVPVAFVPVERAAGPAAHEVSNRPAGPAAQVAAGGADEVRVDAAGRTWADAAADDASLDRLYGALGVGDAERVAGLELRTDRLENQARGLDARTEAVERRLYALEGRVALVEGATRAPQSPESGVDGSHVPGGLQDQRLSLAASGPPQGPGAPGAALGSAELIFGVWLAGMLIVLGSLLLGMVRLRLIARRAIELDRGRLARMTDILSAHFDLARAPRLLLGDDDSIPMTWGVLKPMLLLPESAEFWQAWRIEAVLRHELGHVKRRDYLAQIGAHVLCAIYWFNPLTWIAAQQMRLEREHACDDLVLAGGHEAPDYARDLLDLARSFRSGGRAEAVALGMARPDHLRDRLIALLDDTRNRSAITRPHILRSAGAATVLALSLAAVTPVGVAPSAGEEAPAALETGDSPPLESVRSPSASREVGDPAGPPGGPLPSPEDPSPAGESDVPLGGKIAISATAQEGAVLCRPADGEGRRSSQIRDDDLTIIELQYGDCTSSIRIEGEITFTDDFSTIATLSRGGMLRIEVARRGIRQRLEARPGSDGAPSYTWSVDGRDQPFDSTARRWLESALLDLFRGSSFMADERAAWILRREGPGGLLAEVERMWSGHGQARYLSIALETGSLTAAQVRGTLQVAGRVVESDHALGQVLMAAAANYSFDAATRNEFLRAAGSLESDHQQGRVFGAALSRGDLDGENLEVLLESAAAGIESDHQMAEILVTLAERYPLESGLREPFLRAAGTLGSDHQQGRVYGVVLEQPGLRPDELATVLQAAKTIESDHQLAELLVAATEHDLSDPALRAALLDAAVSIASAHNRSRVYVAALQNTRLSDTDLAAILTAAGNIGSDHQLASLLAEVAERKLSGAAIQRAYLETASHIESDHNLSSTLTLFVQRRDIGEQELIGALETARQIESDHSLAGFLIEFAQNQRVEGQVREAFLETLDRIESEHQHGRVSSRLVGNGR
jgi:beta-lactamase regulating signal transducer with metallopeptidase domain